MSKTKRPGAREIVALSDLVPQHEVKGGGARRVFGAESAPPQPATARRADPKAKVQKGR